MWSGFGVQSSVSETWVGPAAAGGTSARVATSSWRRSSGLRMRHLVLPGDEQSLGQGDESVEAKRDARKDQHGGEDSARGERGLGLEHDEAKPRRGAGPFAEHGSNRGVGGGDPGAGEDGRQSAGQFDPAEDRPAVAIEGA